MLFFGVEILYYNLNGEDNSGFDSNFIYKDRFWYVFNIFWFRMYMNMHVFVEYFILFYKHLTFYTCYKIVLIWSIYSMIYMYKSFCNKVCFTSFLSLKHCSVWEYLKWAGEEHPGFMVETNLYNLNFWIWWHFVIR